VPGRFPLFTDNHVRQPILDGLARLGWRIVRAVDAFREAADDTILFEYAAKEDLVFVTSDKAIHGIATEWLRAGRAFRMVFWRFSHHERMSDGDFIDAFEDLAAKPDAFVYLIEYIKPRR
jgi:hypothetical protein